MLTEFKWSNNPPKEERGNILVMTTSGVFLGWFKPPYLKILINNKWEITEEPFIWIEIPMPPFEYILNLHKDVLKRLKNNETK